MLKITTTLTLLSLLLLAPGAVPAQSPDFVVVVHADAPIESIDRAELSAIFLKKQHNWADGSRIDPVDLSATTSTREVFSERIHGLSAAALQAYWQRQIFSGRDTPPRVKSVAEAIDHVRSTPGSIAYLPAAQAAPDLKVIAINHESPQGAAQ